MLKIKLLILWFKRLFFISLLFGISACDISYLYNNKVKLYNSLIFIEPSSELTGMLMTSQFRYFFYNKNFNTAKYILKTNLKIEENLQLNDKYGFATQGELWITLEWQIIDKLSGKVYISSSDYHPSYYTIMPSSYSTNNNKDIATNLTIKNLTKNVSLKIITLLKKTNGNLNNLSH